MIGIYNTRLKYSSVSAKKSTIIVRFIYNLPKFCLKRGAEKNIAFLPAKDGAFALTKLIGGIKCNYRPVNYQSCSNSADCELVREFVRRSAYQSKIVKRYSDEFMRMLFPDHLHRQNLLRSFQTHNQNLQTRFHQISEHFRVIQMFFDKLKFRLPSVFCVRNFILITSSARIFRYSKRDKISAE